LKSSIQPNFVSILRFFFSNCLDEETTKIKIIDLKKL
jgi:hypothetical protein